MVESYVEPQTNNNSNNFLHHLLTHDLPLGTLYSDSITNYMSSPQGYKSFLCSTQLSMKFQVLLKTKILKNKDCSCFQALSCCIYHAINCYAMINSWSVVEHEIFYNL